MNWKKLLESVSESVNDHLRLRNAYLLAETRILCNQINGRVQLTDSERNELAELDFCPFWECGQGKAVGKRSLS